MTKEWISITAYLKCHSVFGKLKHKIRNKVLITVSILTLKLKS